VKQELRNRLRWHRLNLFQESYPFRNPFHVIFCRNVMIYFDRPSQEQLIARLTRQLVPGGYLMIGHSESLSGIPHTLQPVRPAIYRKPFK
jgi:chemotaxis protein methyltransferase CheR